MIEHAKEPWNVENVEFGAEVTEDLCILASSPSFREIAQISRCYQGDRDKEMEQANARRIVACVNACAGVPMDWLESGLPGCLQNVREERDAYLQQRDDLLSELRAAHQIIKNSLNIMDNGQKLQWAMRNGLDGCDGEGVTRANEREAVINRAEGREVAK